MSFTSPHCIQTDANSLFAWLLKQTLKLCFHASAHNFHIACKSEVLIDDMYTRKNLTTCTHVKISQLVASLQTSRQQVVFARLVKSCQQVWNKLLTTCNNLVNIVRLVARLFQQGCYNHDITILLQPCVVNLEIFLFFRDYIRLVRTT